MPIFRLSEKISFPPPHFAEPEGLLAVGGDLSEKRILLAYQMGIFPWFAEKEPILWWSPDPRLLIYPSNIYVSKRLKRTIRQATFQTTCDTAFDRVISACASIRVKNFKETWIGDEMIDAYCRLFKSGYAHSVEVWYRGELAGGLYGLSLGGSFFGESMFSYVSNTSKIALVALCRFLNTLSFDMIDCQVKTDHLKRMGAVEVSRSRFLKQLQHSMPRQTLKGNWKNAFQEFCDRCT
jgi:leucyl/phenylalanyl-tRNA--protein transferase